MSVSRKGKVRGARAHAPATSEWVHKIYVSSRFSKVSRWTSQNCGGCSIEKSCSVRSSRIAAVTHGSKIGSIGWNISAVASRTYSTRADWSVQPRRGRVSARDAQDSGVGPAGEGRLARQLADSDAQPQRVAGAPRTLLLVDEVGALGSSARQSPTPRRSGAAKRPGRGAGHPGRIGPRGVRRAAAGQEWLDWEAAVAHSLAQQRPVTSVHLTAKPEVRLVRFGGRGPHPRS